MRGREKAKKLSFILSLAEAICSLIPRPIATRLFSMVRHWNGYIGFGTRYILIRRLAKACGENVAIYPGCYIYHLEGLELKNNISIHEMCYLDAYGGISIESDVSIAHGTTLFSAEHDYVQTEVPMRDAPVIKKPIIVQADVWIASGVRVLGGVTVSKGSVIGAGSVVTKDVPSQSVAVGVPAKVLLKRTG